MPTLLKISGATRGGSASQGNRGLSPKAGLIPDTDLAGESRFHVQRLIAAANELLSLAADIERHLPGPEKPEHVAGGRTTQAIADDIRWLAHARKAYRDRRSREHAFGSTDLFGEPAWDLLLDLFIAAKEGKQVPVTSACIGAAVPTTTALRWLAVLEDRGLVLREADPADARRAFVRLSADAYARMVAHFERAAREDEALRTDGRWDGQPDGDHPANSHPGQRA